MGTGPVLPAQRLPIPIVDRGTALGKDQYSSTGKRNSPPSCTVGLSLPPQPTAEHPQQCGCLLLFFSAGWSPPAMGLGKTGVGVPLAWRRTRQPEMGKGDGADPTGALGATNPERP